MTAVTLPQLSLAMEEARIARWLVADGSRVASGQPIMEVETDKALAEIEAPADGQVRFMAEEGAVVSINTTLAEIVDVDAGPRADSPPVHDKSSLASDAGSSASAKADKSPPARRHRASPAVRRMARERGIDLAQLTGSGPGGQVVARDLEQESAAATRTLRESVVAQLTASWREIPHIHIGGELDGTGLAAAKGAAPDGTTVTDLLILAVIEALGVVPELNGTAGKPSRRIHLALAVDTPNGVISPVIRDADQLALREITSERARLVRDARAGVSAPRDLAGGTFTLTNLGAYPVDFFAPIVSGPQAAMLATGRLATKPVAVDGVIMARYRIWINVAIDHRVGDGVTGARFLAAMERSMHELANRVS
jgi:pyruvate dehydrogenase E2 component (dihydrolipoamide acetyltransferase)